MRCSCLFLRGLVSCPSSAAADLSSPASSRLLHSVRLRHFARCLPGPHPDPASARCRRHLPVAATGGGDSYSKSTLTNHVLLPPSIRDPGPWTKIHPLPRGQSSISISTCLGRHHRRGDRPATHSTAYSQTAPGQQTIRARDQRPHRRARPPCRAVATVTTRLGPRSRGLRSATYGGGERVRIRRISRPSVSVRACRSALSYPFLPILRRRSLSSPPSRLVTEIRCGPQG